VGPIPAGGALDGAVFVPGTTKGQMRPVEVSGHLFDANDRPAANIAVVLLMRPVQKTANGTIEPVPDPLSTTVTKRGKFRVLARATTDAEGRFVLRGGRSARGEVRWRAGRF
jgi:hypothetical protein